MNSAVARRTLAITHAPSPKMEHGQRTHIGRTAIDFARTCRQHKEYCQMLRDCGADVQVLAVNREWPDSVFVEDTAIVLDEVAVLASMGMESRRGETAIIELELQKHRPIERIALPATMEGGDVLRVGRTLLVGVSSRTDRAGVQALEAIVLRHGYKVLRVTVRGCLHLKTACTALPDETLLVNPGWLDVAALRGFECVTVPESEPWAANIALVGGAVCLAAEHKRTAEMIHQRGLDVRTVELSEFAKAEGGVTCLSLLFSARAF
jgi:dimethylargininase